MTMEDTPKQLKKKLGIVLASPRGFCAGVDRAIQIVEQALIKYGAPVYVRHEIVHNKTVVDDLKSKGAIFVEELDEIPANHNDCPVIFSAHGVPKSVPASAERLNMFYIDATCPLVSKVHREAERHHGKGEHIILVGHKGHPEVAGTMGQLPDGAVTLIETVADVDSLNFKDTDHLAYVTQTTLSVDDTADIVEMLKAKYPNIKGPHKEDICYATTNRQDAVKALAKEVDAMLVVGAPNSSNSNRLVEVALNYGCKKARLIQNSGELEVAWLADVDCLGITAGASAPERLIQELISDLSELFDVDVSEKNIRDENVLFNIPKVLRN